MHFSYIIEFGTTLLEIETVVFLLSLINKRKFWNGFTI